MDKPKLKTANMINIEGVFKKTENWHNFKSYYKPT
jgi:hypothetical protein